MWSAAARMPKSPLAGYRRRRQGVTDGTLCPQTAGPGEQAVRHGRQRGRCVARLSGLAFSVLLTLLESAVTCRETLQNPKMPKPD